MGLFRRRGSSYWWYKFKKGGKTIEGSTKLTDFKSAKKVFEARRSKYILGEEVPGEKPQIKLGELLETYMRDHARLNKRSGFRDEARCRRLLEFFGNCRASEVTPQRVEQFKAFRRQQLVAGHPIAPSTCNRDLACLKTAFSKGVLWGLVDGNPVKRVSLFNEKDRGRMRLLTQEEKARLLAACSTALRRLVIFALKTGTRQGEMLALRWSDVDTVGNRIVIRKSKSGKIRPIPIHPDVAEVLQGVPRRGEHVFSDKRGGPLSRMGWVRTQFHLAVEKAGLGDYRWHDLRHQFCSDLIMAGCDAATVKELAGHSSLAVTERYVHLHPQHRITAINLLKSERKTPESTPRGRQKLRDRASTRAGGDNYGDSAILARSTNAK